MRSKSIPARVLSSLLLMLTACGDNPVAVLPAHQPASATPSRSVGGLHTGEVPFFCVVGRQDPNAVNGWKSQVDTLFFPRADLDQGGRRVQYRLRKATSTGRLYFGADCSVPYTEAALRRVDRYLGVKADGGAAQYRAREEMVSTQGCVADESACLLPPIVVTSPVRTTTDPEDVCTRFPDECQTNGGGSGGDGGGGDSLSAYDQGPLAWVACIGAGLTAIGGGMLSYAAVEQYYLAVSAYGSARLRYERAGSVPEQSNYYGEMLDAERNMNAMTIALAGSAAVSVGGLLAVVALCSPSVLLPTP